MDARLLRSTVNYIFSPTLSLSFSLVCFFFFHRELFSIHHFLLDRFPVTYCWRFSLSHRHLYNFQVTFSFILCHFHLFTCQLALLCGEYVSSFRLETHFKKMWERTIRLMGKMATIKEWVDVCNCLWRCTSFSLRPSVERALSFSIAVYICVCCLVSCRGWWGFLSAPKDKRGETKNYFKKNGLRVSRVMDEIVYLHRAHL